LLCTPDVPGVRNAGVYTTVADRLA